MSIAEIGDASLWQFGAALAGWNAVHGDENTGLSQQDEDDLWQGIKDRMH